MHSKDGVFKYIAVICELMGATHYSSLSILENRQAGGPLTLNKLMFYAILRDYKS